MPNFLEMISETQKLIQLKNLNNTHHRPLTAPEAKKEEQDAPS